MNKRLNYFGRTLIPVLALAGLTACEEPKSPEYIQAQSALNLVKADYSGANVDRSQADQAFWACYSTWKTEKDAVEPSQWTDLVSEIESTLGKGNLEELALNERKREEDMHSAKN